MASKQGLSLLAQTSLAPPLMPVET